jgi:hypothetical protein
MVSELLEKISRALDEWGIPYMIIGGQAVLVHGEPRMTEDIDVTLGVSSDSLETVIRFVTSLGWEIMVENPETFVKRTMVLPCRDPQSGIKIDLIFSFSPYERQAIGRAVKIRFGSRFVRFASVEDLVVHKIIAGRPRDIEDARLVLAKNPNIDEKYLRSWLKEFEDATEIDYSARYNAISSSLRD